ANIGQDGGRPAFRGRICATSRRVSGSLCTLAPIATVRSHGTTLIGGQAQRQFIFIQMETSIAFLQSGNDDLWPNKSLQRARRSVFGFALRSPIVPHLLGASLSLVRS